MLAFCAIVVRDQAEIEKIEREEELEKESDTDDEIADWPGRKKTAAELRREKEEQEAAKAAAAGPGEKKESMTDELKNIFNPKDRSKKGPTADVINENDSRLIVAASGCLAQLTEDDTICKMISQIEQFSYLLDLVASEKTFPDAEFRAATAICNILASGAVLGHVKHLAQGALEKRKGLGWKHPRSKQTYDYFLEFQSAQENEGKK
eukprot:g2265.t1